MTDGQSIPEEFPKKLKCPGCLSDSCNTEIIKSRSISNPFGEIINLGKCNGCGNTWYVGKDKKL